MRPPSRLRGVGSIRSEDLPELEPISEPEQLAMAFRSTRLIALFGQPPRVRAEWLRRELLPELSRRASDRLDTVGITPRVQIPFAERRTVLRPGRARESEIAVFFDGWNGDARAGLLMALDAAVSAAAAKRSMFALEPDALVRAIEAAPAFERAVLDSPADAPDTEACRPAVSERTRQFWPAPKAAPPVDESNRLDGMDRGRLALHVGALARLHGVRFRVVLERFDECFDATTHSAEAAMFVEDLVDVLNQNALPIHVLVAMRPPDEPMFHALCNRVRDCEVSSFHLALAEAREPPFPQSSIRPLRAKLHPLPSAGGQEAGALPVKPASTTSSASDATASTAPVFWPNEWIAARLNRVAMAKPALAVILLLLMSMMLFLLWK